MLSIILQLTIRNLFKNRLYNLISIIGLTLAMTSSFFILVWVNQELSFDRFHPDANRLYRLTFEYDSKVNQSHFARTYEDWVMQIPGYFPEVEQMIRLQSFRQARIKIKDNKFYNSRFFCADSAFFNVFGFELVRGNPDKVLSEPRSVVLAENVVRKYFGDEDPIGKEIFSGHQFDTIMNMYTVTGVMKDFPANSHVHIDVLGSLDDPEQPVGWAYIYILLHEGIDPGKMLEKFPDFLKQFMNEEQVAWWTPHLQPVQDIHLYSDKDREIEQNGKADNVYIFIIVAILLLIVALINYANIQHAEFNKKLDFVFLNRIFGARIRDVSKFIAFESAIHNLISLIIAVIILLSGLPLFNRLFGYQLNLHGIFIWIQIIVLGILMLALGIVAGSYPVIILGTKEKIYNLGGRILFHSGYNLIEKKRKISRTKLMILLQFLASVVLIMSTLLIYLQLDFMLQSGIGSGQKDILVLKNLPVPVLDKYMIFKSELLSNPLIKEVSASMQEPGTEVLDAMQYEMDGMDESMKGDLISVFPVDNTFLDFYNIPLIAGKNFPDYGGMEKNEYYIINQSALKKLGLDSPEDALGRQFKLIFQWPEIFKGGQIIGVSEDFHFYSMAKPIKPMIMFQKHIWFWCFLIRVDENNFSDAVKYLNETWEKIYPDYPIEYQPIDQLYATIYRTEIVQARILGIFSFLTILISCLGLVGLVLYSTEIRTKEIGIRKVSGAGVFRILLLLNGEILILITLALLTGIPLTWYIISKWLQDYVYRIDIHWWIFVIAGLGIIMLSMLSVSLQTWRAASRNPSDSLRYE
jgi:putative ABC transport system permease protein